MATDDSERFVVSERCCCDGFYATIRFVGDVPPAKGVWVGVEWDDATRGKHNGYHEGTQYFTCSKPESGSFVRPKKLTLGYTFIDSLRERYADSSGTQRDEEGGSEGEEEMFVISRNSLVTPVEMVGADKIHQKTSQLGDLGSVSTSVRGMLISSAGPPGDISSVAPRIQDLDISSNYLLSSWQTVANICSQLHQLRTLNVSENQFLSLPDDTCTLTPAFWQVEELSINKMQLSWNQMCTIVSMFPNLKQLHSCENTISRISSQLPLNNITLLNLEDNQINSWEDVTSLYSLTRLETLILNDNNIPDILRAGQKPIFPCLRSLSICRNSIHSWSSVICLSSLPALRELKIKGNPLFKGDSELNSRQLVIAHLPLLQTLNGSPVNARERVVAERYYLTKYSSVWIDSQQESEVEKRLFEQAHPRYTELANVHNIPLEILRPTPSSGPLLKSCLLSLTVRCPDQPEAKQLSKRLPSSMTVQKLKGLLQRVYTVNTTQQRLSYIDNTRGIEIEIDDNLKQLSYYSIQSGDIILLRW